MDDDPHRMERGDLFVRSAFRGSGNRRSGDAATYGNLQSGRRPADELVWHTNESAIRFYEHIGAQSVDTVRLMPLNL